MPASEALPELDIRSDEEALPCVARVEPAALLEIARAAISVGGAVWIRVTGKSMNPLIRHGDRVLVGALRTAPAVGAIVLLDAGGMPLLHRVVAKSGDTITTRGDSRRTSDQPRRVTDVVGRAVIVRRGGTPICLVPTLAFGIAPLFRALAWWVRVRIPGTWMLRRPRGRQYVD